jgi:lipopolysaccharide biosynthesis regulator YciM
MVSSDATPVGLYYVEKYRAKQEAKSAKNKAHNLPKVFEYYCPHCLFQTNEYTKLCPKCRSHRLVKTENTSKNKVVFKSKKK